MQSVGAKGCRRRCPVRRPNKGAKGFDAPDWFAYEWTNVPKGKQPPTRKNTRGKVVVIHAFQGW